METLWYLILLGAMILVFLGVRKWKKYGLFLVWTVGAVITGFLGFGMHHQGWYSWASSSDLRHAQGWELAALFWTVPCAFYYWFGFQKKNEERLKGGRIRGQIAAVFLLLIAPLLVLWATYLALGNGVQGTEIRHLLVVTGIAVNFFVVDWLLGMTKAAVVADLPIVIGFAVLIAFVWSHRNCGHGDPGILIPGAIALQLIVSNVLFLLVEGGLTEPGVLDKLAWYAAASSKPPRPPNDGGGGAVH